MNIFEENESQQKVKKDYPFELLLVNFTKNEISDQIPTFVSKAIFRFFLFNVYGFLHFGLIMLVLPSLRVGSSLFWPANGIVISGLLIFNVKDHVYFIMICLAWQFLAYTLNAVLPLFRFINLGINLVEWVIVTYGTLFLLNKFGENKRLNFTIGKDVLLFLLSVLAGTSVTGILGATYFAVRFKSGFEVSYFIAAVKWTLDDFIGILIIIPLILTIPTTRKDWVKNKRAGQVKNPKIKGLTFSILFITESILSLLFTYIPVVYRLSNYLKILTLLYAASILQDYISYFLFFLMAMSHYIYFSIIDPTALDKYYVKSDELYWNRGFLILVQLANIGLLLVFNNLSKVYESVERKVEERTKQLTSTMDNLNKTLENSSVANSNKENFISFLCHELRNPLHGINNFLEYLEETPLNIEQTTYLLTLKQSSLYMTSFLSEVLDMAKFESNKVVIENIPVNVKEIIKTISLYSETQCSKKNILFELVIKNKIPSEIRTDPTRLQQILYNLISNAIKFTPNNGNIILSVEFQDQWLSISVKDNGIGIEKDVQKKLFQPFTQANSETTRKYGGTGLGLAITKTIVENMKGNIKLESEFGHGSEFKISLPVQPITSNENREFDTITATRLNSTAVLKDRMIEKLKFEETHEEIKKLECLNENKDNIIIVDDSKINRMILSKSLKQFLNVNIQEFDSGEDVLTFLKTKNQKQPIVIFMDFYMEGICGDECALQIRSLEGYEDAIIVLVSGDNISVQDERYKMFSESIMKPFTKKDILELLTDILPSTYNLHRFEL